MEARNGGVILLTRFSMHFVGDSSVKHRLYGHNDSTLFQEAPVVASEMLKEQLIIKYFY